MIRQGVMKHLGRWLLVGLVLLGLGGCGAWGGPPQAAIAAAVQQQAEATQQQLWQGVGANAETPGLKMDRIKARRTRRLPGRGTPVYEVQGSYRFSIQYSSRRVSQSQVPFSVRLQPTPEGDQWQWVRSLQPPP
jgi:predicted small lipoprotein YifL